MVEYIQLFGYACLAFTTIVGLPILVAFLVYANQEGIVSD